MVKCGGKLGYHMNILQIYRNRGEKLLNSLKEENREQCAFVCNFFKADYINVTKILLYLQKNKKARTYFDGLFIDEQFSSYFTFLVEEHEKIKNCYIEERVKDRWNEQSQNEKIETEEIKEHKNIIQRDKLQVEKKEKIKAEAYRKIIINNAELGNVMDVMTYSGKVNTIENMIYYLNPCSVLAVHFLKIQKNDRVLDMCAAPGGKSLVIANQLFGFKKNLLNRIKNISVVNSTNNCINETVIVDCDSQMESYCQLNKKGVLVANEYSTRRYKRLTETLKKYIPEDIFNSSNLEITKYDGLNINHFIRFPKFDKILLDAPCSSDSYLLEKKHENELNKWSYNVVKNNSNVQFQLLYNAFYLLKPGGTLIYSTCALSPEENDNVVKRLIKSHKPSVKVIDFVKEEFIEIQRKSQNNFKNMNYFLPYRKNMKGENDDKNKTSSTIKFLSFLEPTEYGYMSLPDKSPFGILYICKIKKV